MRAGLTGGVRGVGSDSISLSSTTRASTSLSLALHEADSADLGRQGMTPQLPTPPHLPQV